MPKKEQPTIVVFITKKGLAPASAFDEELLAQYPLHTEFALEDITRRSLPQLNTYWKALSDTIKACGWTMPKEALSREIKERLGYVAPYRTMTGELRYSPDSIALHKMKPQEFQEFMDKAMALLAEHAGFDPLRFLEAA